MAVCGRGFIMRWLAHLRRIIRVDLKSELFTYDIDPKALALARAMDGKLLLVTNVKDLSADEVVAQYKALADIERSFKVLTVRAVDDARALPKSPFNFSPFWRLLSDATIQKVLGLAVECRAVSFVNFSGH